MIDLLSDAGLELLASDAVAVVATLDVDGSPHLSAANHVNEWGLREYLVVNGVARIAEGGAAALLQRLAHTYLGPDVVFPAMPDPPPGFVTRIRVDRVSGVGSWRAEG